MLDTLLPSFNETGESNEKKVNKVGEVQGSVFLYEGLIPQNKVSLFLILSHQKNLILFLQPLCKWLFPLILEALVYFYFIYINGKKGFALKMVKHLINSSKTNIIRF